MVAIPIPKKMNIGPRTINCILFGYAYNNSAYRFLVHKSDNSDVHFATIIESKNELFFEDVFPYKSTQETSYVKELMTLISSKQDQEEGTY